MNEVSSIERAIVIGSISVTGVYPEFRLPILIGAGKYRSNTCCIQVLGVSDAVASFKEFDVDGVNLSECSDQDRSISIGDAALWCFSTEEELLWGTRDELVPQLKKLLDHYRDNPFGYLQIARFCDLGNIASIEERAFKFLREHSESGSKIWRDVDVFLPVIRKEILRLLPTAQSDVQEIDISSHGNAVEIRLPLQLYQNLGSGKRQKLSDRFKKYCDLYDVTDFRINEGDSIKATGKKTEGSRVLLLSVFAGGEQQAFPFLRSTIDDPADVPESWRNLCGSALRRSHIPNLYFADVNEKRLTGWSERVAGQSNMDGLSKDIVIIAFPGHAAFFTIQVIAMRLRRRGVNIITLMGREAYDPYMAEWIKDMSRAQEAFQGLYIAQYREASRHGGFRGTIAGFAKLLAAVSAQGGIDGFLSRSSRGGVAGFFGRSTYVHEAPSREVSRFISSIRSGDLPVSNITNIIAYVETQKPSHLATIERDIGRDYRGIITVLRGTDVNPKQIQEVSTLLFAETVSDEADRFRQRCVKKLEADGWELLDRWQEGSHAIFAQKRGVTVCFACISSEVALRLIHPDQLFGKNPYLPFPSVVLIGWRAHFNSQIPNYPTDNFIVADLSKREIEGLLQRICAAAIARLKEMSPVSARRAINKHLCALLYKEVQREDGYLDGVGPYRRKSVKIDDMEIINARGSITFLGYSQPSRFSLSVSARDKGVFFAARLSRGGLKIVELVDAKRKSDVAEAVGRFGAAKLALRN